MVKGLTRRVIVIKSPDADNIFDEAIFLVREDAINAKGISGAEIVNQAQEIAGRYVKKDKKRIPAPVFSLFGAVFTGLVWLAVQLFIV